MAADGDQLPSGPHGLSVAVSGAVQSVPISGVDCPLQRNVFRFPHAHGHPIAIRQGRVQTMMLWLWEGVRYLAAYGAITLIIGFWYWIFKSIGTF